MNSNEYNYLKEVLDKGSITEAAKNLYISQSALSQYIKRIEDRLGIDIFDRDYTPLRLTEAGEIYYQSLEDIHNIAEYTRMQIEDLNNLKIGEVNVGSTDYQSYYFLSKVIKKFKDQYPGIDIKLFEGKTAQLNSYAQRGDCDFSITYEITNVSDLTNIKLYDEEVFVAIPADDDLVKKLGLSNDDGVPTIDIGLLMGKDIIRMKEGQNLNLIFSQLDNYTEKTLKTVIKTDNMFLANKFVSEGLGISLIPAAMASDSKLNVVYVRTNPGLSGRTAVIHYNSTKKVKKPAQILMEMIIDYARRNY